MVTIIYKTELGKSDKVIMTEEMIVAGTSVLNDFLNEWCNGGWDVKRGVFGIYMAMERAKKEKK